MFFEQYGKDANYRNDVNGLRPLLWIHSNVTDATTRAKAKAIAKHGVDTTTYPAVKEAAKVIFDLFEDAQPVMIRVALSKDARREVDTLLSIFKGYVPSRRELLKIKNA